MRAIEFFYAVACDLGIQETMLTSDCYKAFYLAAQNGQSDAMGLIYRQMNQTGDLQKILVEVIGNHERWSREQNYRVAVSFLWDKAAQQGGDMRAVVSGHDYGLFTDAALNSNTRLMEFLWVKALEQGCQVEMLAAQDYRAFRLASQQGYLLVVEYLYGLAAQEDRQIDAGLNNNKMKPGFLSPKPLQKECRREMLSADNYIAFRIAAQNGHLLVVQSLYEKALEQKCQRKMLAADSYIAFHVAAQNGHLSVVQFLYEKAVAQRCQTEMLAIDNYGAFSIAAQNGHLSIIQFLYEKAVRQGCQKEMLASDNYIAFRIAAQNGDLSVVQCLYEKAVEQRCQREILTADNYFSFRIASKEGHLFVVQSLYEKAVEEGCHKEMLAADNYYAFQVASEKGHLVIVQYLYEKAVEHGCQVEMLAADSYITFRIAAQNGDLSVVQCLYEKAVEQRCQTEMLAIDNYFSFRIAAQNGHLSIIQFLYEKAVEQRCQREMLSADNYVAFRIASKEGHLLVVQFLYEKAVEQDCQLEMLAASHYVAFCIAAEKGHLSVVQCLYEKAVEQRCQREMLSANNYIAFLIASQENHLLVVQFLYEKAVAHCCQLEMLAAQDYRAFRLASQQGHLLVVEYLYSLAVQEDRQIDAGLNTNKMKPGFSSPKLLQKECRREMLAADNYIAFRIAAEKGHLSVVQCLYEKAVEQGCQTEMLSADNYGAFRIAAQNGHLSVVQFLYEKAVAHRCQLEMLAAQDYRAFRLASQQGHLLVVEYLYGLAVKEDRQIDPGLNSNKMKRGFLNPKPLQKECRREMLAADNYIAFRIAAKKGHLLVVQSLYEKALEQKCQRKMLAADKYIVFRIAAQNGQLSVVQYLYEKAVAQRCQQEMLAAESYSNLNVSLSSQGFSLNFQQSFTLIYGAFCIAAEEGHLSVVQLLYAKSVEQNLHQQILAANNYVALRLAAQNVHLNVMQFLWDKAGEQGCQSNMIAANNYEVYTTAALNNRAEVVDFLEQVASPQDLVLMRQRTAQLRQQIFERVGEQAAAHQPAADLRAQAANAESAMVGLSQEQIAQLEDIRNHYGVQMNPAAVIAEFRTLMTQKYRDKPAQYGGHHLPLTYEELEVFLRDQSLSSQRHNILRAYYRHEVHTVYRYLLPENPWLHAEAVFGVVIENNLRKKTVFEQHQELIAVLFKAAIDPDIVSPEVSAEDRLNFFIASFGDIARAHNREATGFATASEADDMQADKPSCSSGILRRLLSAVIGHPLLIPFSEILDTQITEKMKQHFASKITAGHAQILLEAWKSCVEFPEEQSITILKQLDPSEEELQALMSGVQRDLSAQVVLSQRLTQYVQSPAAVDLISSKLRLPAGMPCYAICFAQRVGLQTMLESAVAELGETINNQALLLSVAMPSTDEQSRANRPARSS